MDANDLLARLGRRADDESVEQVFVELRTRRRPRLASEEDNEFRSWVLIRRRGIELGFMDEAYLRASERPKGSRGRRPLVLYQVYFYTRRDDISDFSGRLPFNLQWMDSREVVRRKLAHESTRRSYLKDAWDLTGYRMIVDYKPQGKAIDMVVCELRLTPWAEKGRRQPSLGASDFIPLFGLPASSPVLREKLRPLDLMQRIKEEEDDHAVDFRSECGINLYFTASKNLRLKRRATLAKSGDMVLGAVRFLGPRELNAREWKGELPFHLSFEDSQEALANKVGRAPDNQEDDFFQGFAEWHFSDFTLHVMYSNMANRVIRVMVTAPGY